MPLESPSIIWHDAFPFGGRVCLSTAEKQAVGEYVIKSHIDRYSVVFLSDGSSTFHLALRLFRSPLQLTLLTTNVAIAVERAVREPDEAVRQLEVDLAGGIVDSELLMVRGDNTEDTVEKWIQKVDVLIVSMRSYSRKTGPTERHPPSQRQISIACQKAIEASKKIITS